MIPDDIKQSLDVLGFYKGISSHSFDDRGAICIPMDSSNLIKAQLSGKGTGRSRFRRHTTDFLSKYS